MLPGPLKEVDRTRRKDRRDTNERGEGSILELGRIYARNPSSETS